MYADPTPRSKGLWPLAGICCLGIIVFLLASTIILALIPLYIPQKSATPASKKGSTFYLEYSASADGDSAVSGTVQNPSQVATASGVGDSVSVESGTAVAGISRRRRSSSGQRSKRDLTINFLFVCVYKYKDSCTSQTCRNNSEAKVNQQIALNTNTSSLNFTILTSDGQIVSSFFNLVFIGRARTIPSQFVGLIVSSTLEFVAVQSGLFMSRSTWGGAVPWGNCSVTIPVGITVSYPRRKLEIKMRSLVIYGKLEFGSDNDDFEFKYGASVIVRSGGKIGDKTRNKRIKLPVGAIITILSGGGFDAAGTTIESSAGGNSVSAPTSGPFTCGSVSRGSLLSFNRVTFIARQSGGFTSGSTFLGGFAPSDDMCASGGCGVYVPAGVILNTADLNGVLSINIAAITVASGGSIKFGTPGSSAGFKFKNSVILDIMGSAEFAASGGQLLLPVSSSFNIGAGGTLVSGIGLFAYQIFNPLTDAMIGGIVSLTLGPYATAYIITIGSDGTVSINNSGASSTTTTSTMSFPTSGDPSIG